MLERRDKITMELQYLEYWNRRYGYGTECLLVKLLRDKHLTNEQIDDVLNVLSSVCKFCYDNYKDCKCWTN